MPALKPNDSPLTIESQSLAGSKSSALLGPRFWDWTQAVQSDLAAELRESLSAPSAWISPKFFYDPLGSALFASICELDEYYPTRTEASVFQANRKAIGEHCAGATLIDLGAGDCAKAESLFEVLQPSEYLAVDISVDYLRQRVVQLQQRHPHIAMSGLGLDFSSQLRLPEEIRKDHRLFFYPGSSIGNFKPDQAVSFLKQLRALEGKVLLGIDLVKPKVILNLAYDDMLGVTAAFNLNALRQSNRIIHSNFDLRSWKHLGFFNAQESRIEMHLESTRAMDVAWKNADGSLGGRHFAKGERIHTEYSYKYTPETVNDLLREAGYAPKQAWFDAKQWLGVFFAEPA